jgi:hypothetical protein
VVLPRTTGPSFPCWSEPLGPVHFNVEAPLPSPEHHRCPMVPQSSDAYTVEVGMCPMVSSSPAGVASEAQALGVSQPMGDSEEWA